MEKVEERVIKITRLMNAHLIVKVPKEAAMIGSIFIPETARETPQEAEVIQISDALSLPVDVGDRVLYGKHMGRDIEGVDGTILREEDVIAILLDDGSVIPTGDRMTIKMNQTLIYAGGTLTKQKDGELVTKSGIIIQETSLPTAQEAEILKAGPKVTAVKPGDKVFVHKRSQDPYKIGEQEFYFVTPDDLLAKLGEAVAC